MNSSSTHRSKYGLLITKGLFSLMVFLLIGNQLLFKLQGLWESDKKETAIKVNNENIPVHTYENHYRYMLNNQNPNAPLSNRINQAHKAAWAIVTLSHVYKQAYSLISSLTCRSFFLGEKPHELLQRESRTQESHWQREALHNKLQDIPAHLTVKDFAKAVIGKGIVTDQELDGMIQQKMIEQYDKLIAQGQADRPCQPTSYAQGSRDIDYVHIPYSDISETDLEPISRTVIQEQYQNNQARWSQQKASWTIGYHFIPLIPSPADESACLAQIQYLQKKFSETSNDLSFATQYSDTSATQRTYTQEEVQKWFSVMSMQQGAVSQPIKNTTSTYQIHKITDLETLTITTITKVIQCSSITHQQLLNKAKTSAGQVGNQLGNVVTFTKDDFSILNLANPREVLQWAYAAKEGDSHIFKHPQNYLVVRLLEHKPRGTLPLHKVRGFVQKICKNKQKAKKIKEKLRHAHQQNPSLQHIANAMNQQVHTASNIQFTDTTFGTFTEEDLTSEAIGAIMALQRPGNRLILAAQTGIFLIELKHINLDVLPNVPASTNPLPDIYQARIEAHAMCPVDYRHDYY